MKDEIKIITLGDIFKNLETEEKAFKFKNYITNLQEEIERQSKAQVILDNQIAEMLKYKERCEKAIEYINKNKYVDDYGVMVIEDDGENLLNILNGGDE